MKVVFLILATIATAGGAMPYIRDILRGTTKPNLVSWINWTLLIGIATVAEINSHSYITAIFTGSAVIQTGFIVILGLRSGFVKYSRFEVTCQAAAVIGIVLWQIFNSPVIGVCASVAIDFIGALPTLAHAWHKPHEETWTSYALSGFGGAFALGSLKAYNLISLPYPVYFVLIDVALVWIIISRNKVVVQEVAAVD